MCGRYYLKSEDMNAIIGTLLRTLERKGVPADAKLNGEIYPGDTAPVLCHNRAHETRAFFMDWGFDVNQKRIFNARSETAKEKPMFRESMHQHRCIVPASCYFEWEQTTHQKMNIRPANGHSLFLAGLYRPEKDGRYSYTVLTRAAAPHLESIHPRMPVILPADCIMEWMAPRFNPDLILRHALDALTFSPVDSPFPLISTASPSKASPSSAPRDT